MSNNRHTLLRMWFADMPAFVASVVMATTFVACHVSNPMEPEPIVASSETASYVAAAVSCPSFRDACMKGRDELLKSCPPDGDYKKPGDEKKCVQAALRAYLKSVESCFTSSDLSALRRCVLGSIPPVVDSSGGAGKIRPESRP